MDLNDNQKIFGLPKHLYQGQQDRTDELNYRLLERDVSDKPLAPNFSPRPVLSRYTRFPMIDAHKPANIPIKSNYNYSLSDNFTPPVMKTGPVNGFINNVQDESILRNQIYPLSKNDDNEYVPSSNSDLYKVEIPSKMSVQPYPGLFNSSNFSQELHPNVRDQSSIGMNTFHNNTRTQLRTVVDGK